MAREGTKFGSNGREEILEIALGGGDDEEPAPAPAARCTERRLFAAKQGPAYFKAVDVLHRPTAPFTKRPKLGRILRQRVLERLVGQHLALEALSRRGAASEPGAVAGAEPARRRALQKASEQEADVYQRAASGTVYQSLAALISAADWQAGAELSAGDEAAYQEGMLAEAKTEDRNKRQRTAAQAAPAGAPGALEEGDLDWAGAERDEAARRAALRRAARRRIVNLLAALPSGARLSTEQRVMVADKCADKVAAKGGSLKPDAGAMERLVSDYVDHVLRKKHAT